MGLLRSELMTPAEVAAAFRVDVKTVSRWARAGKLKHTLTLGGHRRYPRDAIEALTTPTTTEETT